VTGAAALSWASAWHDVECSSYGADLPLWRELAATAHGPVLDVGAGTGRVALHLATRGHEVTAIDADPELARACARLARDRRLPVRALAADARSFDLGGRFALALLAMQVAQLLGGRRGRSAMLSTVCRHLRRGGVLAVALADPFEGVPAGEALPPLPDVLERDGWVLSSTPVQVREEEDGTVAIDRLRQAVSPAGELTEEAVTIRLEPLAPETLEQEAADAGLSVLQSRRIEATREHVGSTVVLLESPR
jgi:SAM-dependent methyltransferase